MIKLFEEYNQYYTEMDRYGFYDLCRKTLTFSDDEINILSKEVKVDIDLRYNKEDLKGDNAYIFYMPTQSIDQLFAYIYKIPDEWYLLERTRKVWQAGTDKYVFYKCDQLDGLIKCIKDDKDI